MIAMQGQNRVAKSAGVTTSHRVSRLIATHRHTARPIGPRPVHAVPDEVRSSIVADETAAYCDYPAGSRWRQGDRFGGGWTVVAEPRMADTAEYALEWEGGKRPKSHMECK